MSCKIASSSSLKDSSTTGPPTGQTLSRRSSRRSISRSYQTCRSWRVRILRTYRGSVNWPRGWASIVIKSATDEADSAKEERRLWTFWKFVFSWPNTWWTWKHSVSTKKKKPAAFKTSNSRSRKNGGNISVPTEAEGTRNPGKST